MKLIILTNSISGLKSFRNEIVQTILNRNHSVIIVAPIEDRIDKESKEHFEKVGCRTIIIALSRRGLNPINDFNLFCNYLKILKHEKPDGVLSYTIKPNIYGGLACQILGISFYPNITGLGTSIENPGALQKLSVFLYKCGLTKAKCVFFQNTYCLNFMQSHRVVKSNYVLLPGSGVNLDDHRYEEYPSEDDGIIFNIIGRIMTDKGINEELEAFEVLKKEHPNVIFRFIGRFDENYSEAINSANKKGIIEYLGIQKPIHPWIAQSHATIHASYHEGMSNVLLETAATGRPVIASNVPGCMETFEDGITGIGFIVRSSEAIIEAVDRFLLLTPQERASMGKKGREKMEHEFDRNIVIDKYLETLNID